MGQVGLEAMLLQREEEGFQYGWRTVTDAFLRSALLHADCARFACGCSMRGPRVSWAGSMDIFASGCLIFGASGLFFIYPCRTELGY